MATTAFGASGPLSPRGGAAILGSMRLVGWLVAFGALGVFAAACDSGSDSSGSGAGVGTHTGSGTGAAGAFGTGGGGATGGAGGAGANGTGGTGAGGAGVGGSGGGAGAGGAGGSAGVVCPSPDPLDCSPGSGTGEAGQCFDGPSCYLGAVKSAVVGVINAQPTWFDYNNPNNCPFILQLDPFLDSVVADLEAQGLCAIRDPNAPGEEVTVKHDNAFSENFDIVASTGCARYGDGIYTGYCAPAWW